MPRTIQYRYPWPASAITADEMRLLYQARERSAPRVPINMLIAEAVRQAFGQVVLNLPAQPNPQDKEKENIAA